MLKKLLFISFLMVGCATSQPPVVITPVNVASSADKQSVSPVENQQEHLLNKQVFKGDFWELNASPEWHRTNSIGAEIDLVYADRSPIASIIKMEFVGDLNDFADRWSNIIEDYNGHVMTTRTSFINTRKSIEIESLVDDSVIWVWSFITGAEGYAFLCKGEVSSFEHNRALCLSLIKGLYIGKAQ